MNRSAVNAPNASVVPTRWARAREVVSDLLLAIALVLALPLLLALLVGAGVVLTAILSELLPGSASIGWRL